MAAHPIGILLASIAFGVFVVILASFLSFNGSKSGHAPPTPKIIKVKQDELVAVAQPLNIEENKRSVPEPQSEIPAPNIREDNDSLEEYAEENSDDKTSGMILVGDERENPKVEDAAERLTAAVVETDHLPSVESYAEQININARDVAGDTSLHIEAQRGYINIVSQLVQQGADVNAINYQGSTPLYIAALYGHADIVKFLITAGADINAVNRAGDTPLHVAAQNLNEEVVFALIRNGADSNAVNKNGKTSKQIIDKLVDEIHRLNVKSRVADTESQYLRSIGSSSQLGQDHFDRYMQEK